MLGLSPGLPSFIINLGLGHANTSGAVVDGKRLLIISVLAYL